MTKFKTLDKTYKKRKSRVLPPKDPMLVAGYAKPKKPDIHSQEWYKQEADALLRWVKANKGFYLGTFCNERGYGRHRLVEMELKSTEFASAMERAKIWQECRLIKAGLTKEWDPAFVRFLMARVCGDIWKSSFDKEEGEKASSLIVNINEIRK